MSICFSLELPAGSLVAANGLQHACMHIRHELGIGATQNVKRVREAGATALLAKSQGQPPIHQTRQARCGFPREIPDCFRATIVLSSLPASVRL